MKIKILAWVCRGMIFASLIFMVTNHGDYVVSSLVFGYLLSAIGSGLERRNKNRIENVEK